MLGNTGPARHARAGFLEGEAIETPPPIGPETAAVTLQVQFPINQFSATQVTRAKVTREDRPKLLAVQ